MFKEFETERLIIKPTSEADAELVYQLMNSPKFLKYVGDRGINSIPEAKEYIRTKRLPQLKALGFSSYAIIRKADGLKIGNCGLYDRDGVDGIDIGFGLLPEHEGLGYAYEAASRVLKAAFEDFGIAEVKGITSQENVASQGLLEKLGLIKTGTTKLPNENRELLLYAKKK